MERKELINEIMDFYLEYKVIKPEEEERVRLRIAKNLRDCDYIENLISTIIFKINYSKDTDFEKVNRLLSELEKIRLELEDYDR